jgi:hypothetical protein
MNLENFYNEIKDHTITSPERIKSLYESLEYIKDKNIEGDLVECGVFKGGNVLGMRNFCKANKLNKKIWGYDTFEGMTAPLDCDVDLHGRPAKDILGQVMCSCSYEEVTNLLNDGENLVELQLVKGDVLQTLNSVENIPDKISLLRLDTDWYESTKFELEKLFPLVSIGGIIIIDDYGHWGGCRIAVDEFFKNSDYTFEQIDYTGIKIIKHK